MDPQKAPWHISDHYSLWVEFGDLGLRYEQNCRSGVSGKDDSGDSNHAVNHRALQPV